MVKYEMDIEAEEYLKYAKETMSVSVWKAVGFAAVSTMVLYALLWALHGDTPAYIIALFTDRGWIPYVTTFAFWVGIWLLLLKFSLIREEMDSFTILNTKIKAISPINEETAKRIDEKIEGLETEQKRRMVVRRVKAAIERYIQTKSTSEVGDVLTTVSDIDYDIVESSYTTLRYLVWIIPVLGFIGTVLGISAALGEFGGIIPKAGEMALSEIISSLGGVTKNLGIAFETTLLALALAGILMWVMSIVQKKEENFLSAMDDFCVSKIVNQMVAPPPEPDEIVKGLGEISSKLSSINTATNKLLDLPLGRDDDSKENLNKVIEILKGVPGQLNESIQTSLGPLTNMSEESIKELAKIQKKNLDSIKEKFDTLFTQTSGLFKEGEAVEKVIEGISSVTGLNTVLSENKEVLNVLGEELIKQNERNRELQEAIQTLTTVIGTLATQQTKTGEVLDNLSPSVKTLSEKGVPVKITLYSASEIEVKEVALLTGRVRPEEKEK